MPLLAADDDVCWTGHTDNVYAIDWSRDQRICISIAEDNSAIRWDITTGKPQLVVELKHPVYDVRILPDNKKFITAAADGSVECWSVENGKSLGKFAGFRKSTYSLAISHDGQLVAAGGGEDEPVIQIWEIESAKLKYTLKGHKKPVYGLAFHPADKNRLVSTSSDKSVRIWKLSDQSAIECPGHTSHVYRCEFHPEGKIFATASGDKTVRIWDAQTGKNIHTIRDSNDPIYSVTFSPDGQQLAAVGDDRELKIWSVPDWKRQFSHKFSKEAHYTVRFDPRGPMIRVGTGDGSIYGIRLPK